MSVDFTPFAAARRPAPAPEGPACAVGSARAVGFAPHPQAPRTAGTSAARGVQQVSFQSVRSPSRAEEAERQAGYAAGYAAGWAAATREEAELVEARLQQRTELEHEAVARLDQLGRALSGARECARAMASPELQATAEQLMLAAVTLAEDLVGVVLSEPRRRVSAAVARAVAVEEDAGVVRVRMHPDDVVTYHRMVADHTSSLTLPDGVDLVADPSLRPGDALTELEDGFLDARLSSAIARLREELAAAVPDDARAPQPLTALGRRADGR